MNSEELRNYSNVHQWLRNHHGKASKCENPECVGKSIKYSWALIKGKNYEKNKNNFMQLCYSCHVKYDSSPDKPEKMRVLNAKYQHITNSPEARRKRSLTMMGHIMSQDTKDKIGDAHRGRENKYVKIYLGKPVAQYSLAGELIQKYDSISDALRAIGKTGIGIYFCCKGKYKQSYGYKWIPIRLINEE